MCELVMCFGRTPFINDQAGQGGWTALMMAVSLKLPLTVETLLDMGAGKRYTVKETWLMFCLSPSFLEDILFLGLSVL